MLRSSPLLPSRHVVFWTFALACMATACGTGGLNEDNDATESGAEASADSASQDARSDAAADGDASLDAHAPADANLDAQPAAHDAAIDAHAPAPPPCHSGDRTEWSGAIPDTTIAVSVCSACGKSYVVAANGGEIAGEVTVNNGSATIMANVPAGGMATSAEIADNPNDGRVTVCGTSGSHGCLPVSPQNQKYCNPLRSLAHLVPERIDQGVDYAGSGPIYAIGPGTINVFHNRDDSGWPGGTFISYRLSAGPAAGKDIFLAENVDLNRSLHNGSFVYSGTVLGTLVNAYPNCETGWGVVGGAYTAEHACYVEGCATALGRNFNQLLTCMHAPSGIVEGSGCCTSSMGYPSDWCTELSHWQ